MGQGLFIHEVSRPHTATHHSRYDSSGRVISPTQRPLPDNTQHTQQTNIHAPVGFEPTISAGGRPQTHALDCAVTGTGNCLLLCIKIQLFFKFYDLITVITSLYVTYSFIYSHTLPKNCSAHLCVLLHFSNSLTTVSSLLHRLHLSSSCTYSFTSLFLQPQSKARQPSSFLPVHDPPDTNQKH